MRKLSCVSSLDNDTLQEATWCVTCPLVLFAAVLDEMSVAEVGTKREVDKRVG